MRQDIQTGARGSYGRQCRRCVAFGILILAGLILAGCKGISTKSERGARQGLKTVSQIYRPDPNRRPALPELGTQSGLSNYLAYAMLNQPKIEAAYFDWWSSIERITVERSLPDPQLTFQSDIANFVMTVMPGFMQEFPAPGKLKARADVASAESRSKYFAFESAVLQTAFDLKRAYYNLHFLDARISINRQTLNLLSDLEKIARAQNEVGKVTLQDVYRAQIEQNKVSTELLNLEDSRRPLLAQFKGALGMTRDQPDPSVPAGLETTPLNLNGNELLATAFARNPRLKAMEADMQMAEASIALAAKSKVPDFSIGLMADAKASPTVYRPLAGMTVPIWRDKIAAEIAQAQAGKRAAEARLSAEQISLTVDFALKTYDFREITRDLALLQNQLIPKARQSLEIARSGYLAGTIDFFNLMDTERTLLNFQLAEVEARTRREIVLAELSLMIAGVPPQGAPVLSSNLDSSKSNPSPTR
jgi:cobalt-zinc-cadmium efflux system outer membrane protein